MIDYILYFVSVVLVLLALIEIGDRSHLPPEYRGDEFLGNAVLIWLLFYVMSIGVEFIGHFLGLWTWKSYGYILLHAGVFWANILYINVFCLRKIPVRKRYIILLSVMLVHQFFKEICIGWVSHYPLFGYPFITITLVMMLVCLTAMDQPRLLRKMGLI